VGAALLWIFVLLPSRRRQQRHRDMQDSIDVGDEIITAGGLHGAVRRLDDEDLQLEIAPGVVVKLDRRAVAAVAREVPEEAEEPGDEAAEPEDPDEIGARDHPENTPGEPRTEAEGS
jgi:preprotein translocase subunit YajC